MWERLNPHYFFQAAEIHVDKVLDPKKELATIIAMLFIIIIITIVVLVVENKTPEKETCMF